MARCTKCGKIFLGSKCKCKLEELREPKPSKNENVLTEDK